MIWIALSEKDAANAALKKRLWAAADQFCANSGLKAREYFPPILSLNLQDCDDFGRSYEYFLSTDFACQRGQPREVSAAVLRGLPNRETASSPLGEDQSNGILHQ